MYQNLYRKLSNIIKSTSNYASNLNVNLTNYTNTNLANVSNLIANNMVSDNVLFNYVFLSSNQLYNTAPTYTVERQYPSKLYTSSSTEDTVSLLGKNVYHQRLL